MRLNYWTMQLRQAEEFFQFGFQIFLTNSHAPFKSSLCEMTQLFMFSPALLTMNGSAVKHHSLSV